MTVVRLSRSTGFSMTACGGGGNSGGSTKRRGRCWHDIRATSSPATVRTWLDAVSPVVSISDNAVPIQPSSGLSEMFFNPSTAMAGLLGTAEAALLDCR